MQIVRSNTLIVPKTFLISSLDNMLVCFLILFPWILDFLTACETAQTLVPLDQCNLRPETSGSQLGAIRARLTLVFPALGSSLAGLGSEGMNRIHCLRDY